MARDTAFHAEILNYPLGVVRLRLDEVKTRPGFSNTAEHLLHLHALCVELKCISIMSFSHGGRPDGQWTAHSPPTDGEDTERTPAVHCIVLADKLIRFSEHRRRFHTCSDACNRVLSEHRGRSGALELHCSVDREPHRWVDTHMVSRKAKQACTGAEIQGV